MTLFQERQKGIDLLTDTCRKEEAQSCYTAGSYYINPRMSFYDVIIYDDDDDDVFLNLIYFRKFST